MHSALFVASVPKSKTEWGMFLTYVDNKIGRAPNVLRLAENVWLLDLQRSVSEFAALISIAEQERVAYGVLPFENEPEWLPGGFDPKTIQGRIAP